MYMTHDALTDFKTSYMTVSQTINRKSIQFGKDQQKYDNMHRLELEVKKSQIANIVIPVLYARNTKPLSLTLFAPNNPAFVIPLTLVAH